MCKSVILLGTDRRSHRRFYCNVYGIVQIHGVNGLIIATFMAGVMLIIMGFARLGSVIKFIPHPLIIGDFNNRD